MSLFREPNELKPSLLSGTTIFPAGHPAAALRSPGALPRLIRSSLLP
jgi:hypothetical protein